MGRLVGQEVPAGVEPAYMDLQSITWPLGQGAMWHRFRHGAVERFRRSPLQCESHGVRLAVDHISPWNRQDLNLHTIQQGEVTCQRSTS